MVPCPQGRPASRVAVDMTIEQTSNRHAKSKGGIIGFSQKEAAYQRWCMTRHRRAGFVTLLQSQNGLDSIHDEHKDNNCELYEDDLSQSCQIEY